MTTNLPLPPYPPVSEERRLADDQLAQSAKLERCRQRHEGGERQAGLWTGSREGIINTVIAVVASLVFGGAAGVWFGQDDWFIRSLIIAGGTMLMASLVCFIGSMCSGRNPIFWGIGMPLLVYVAGSFCALLSAGAVATTFLLGAPAFCGLAIVAGVMTAYAMERNED
ncbi:hypothetical protein OKA04_06070 [Luteolibacter flavescens]|uniref:Transmembrane protein n=1 Tax=Luteolibacter flavescens TaxID=1859460 RepID=A0ABT3FMT2_9BACT|nr:hypothetical protein [Luteolibacter flavescens]MCW1884290.1 hypothetical protein [Luteolibacter flavescens]